MAEKHASVNCSGDMLTVPIRKESKMPVAFQQFDVVADYSDHYYAKYKRGDCFSDFASGKYKKIMAEWKILKNNLPESIFVRAYEGRIDLLRAVIIGASGTPYHDGLFVFDMMFPDNYPAKPPSVCYHSFGLRLNPNLYKNGHVCLSLLNTWYGKSKEMRWDPCRSTILQVVVSLQGLVLNEKPYYNEPIFIKPAWSWESYNEKVFELSCTTMRYVLRRPPKNFEIFVASHFCKRARIILRACNAYRDGCVKVGFYRDGEVSPPGTVKVSGALKASMERIYQCLLADFTDNGASLRDFPSSLPLENEAMESKEPIEFKKSTIWDLVVCISIFITLLVIFINLIYFL